MYCFLLQPLLVNSAPGFRRQRTFVLEDLPQAGKKKARKMAATAEDLLFSNEPNCANEDGIAEKTNLNSLLENFPAKSCDDAVISGKKRDCEEARDSSFDSLDFRSDPDILSRSSLDYDSCSAGKVVPFSSKSDREQTSSYLLCTHVAEGHSGGVTSLHCTEDVLFSGSKDNTVKIWDLGTGREIAQLSGHPNTVVKVRYCEYTRLVFSAALHYIKAWDMRDRHSCVHTLISSGTSCSGSAKDDKFPRYVVPSGEHQVNDIALNRYGTTLFSAASEAIRIWDLRKFQSIGALSAGFQTSVTCLAVDEMGMDQNIVVSGSKDHSIKVFEVVEDSRGIQPANFSLEPPHFDSVQALGLRGGSLFSGSRDMCIKKWDLPQRRLLKSLHETHRDWLLSLNVLPGGALFLSGCRSGHLNLWAADSCDLLEDLRAHGSALNDIASNAACVFTASNDTTVGIWRLNNRNYAVSP